MKNIAVILTALAVASPSVAQSTRMMMPEGSKDIYLTLAAAYTPESEGSARRRTYVSPMVSAEFSNGVFIDMNTVGVHLSDNPQFDYGVQATPTVSHVRVPTADGWESKRRFTPEVGAFVRYSLAHGVGLRSALMYGGSVDHRGLRLRLGAIMAWPVAEHHGVGINVDATLANRSALQADFSVLPSHPNAALPLYDAKGGLRDTSINAFWSWQLSTKYTFRSILQWNRLHGGAAASPRIERANGATAITSVTYQF